MARWSLVSVLSACALTATAGAAGASQIQLCDVQPMADYTCNNCTPTSKVLPFAVFEYPNVASLGHLTDIEFTMSMQVADPANPGLRLALDGVDTGLALNGFKRDSLVEQTFHIDQKAINSMSAEARSALENALKDGTVVASLVADKPENLRVQLYSDTDTKLCFTGSGTNIGQPVPEPASVLAWAAAGGLALLRRRRSA